MVLAWTAPNKLDSGRRAEVFVAAASGTRGGRRWSQPSPAAADRVICHNRAVLCCEHGVGLVGIEAVCLGQGQG